MPKSLEGRRIALVTASAADDGGVVRETLEQAGALVQRLCGSEPDSEWHGGRYAGLVAAGAGKEPIQATDRLKQLFREFLVTDKPVAAIGSGVKVLLEAGGLAGRSVAASSDLREDVEASGARWMAEPIHADEALLTAQGTADQREFAGRAAAEFSRRLEESQVDEMSDQSFPASDPPAITTTTAGGGQTDLQE